MTVCVWLNFRFLQCEYISVMFFPDHLRCSKCKGRSGVVFQLWANGAAWAGSWYLGRVLHKLPNWTRYIQACTACTLINLSLLTLSAGFALTTLWHYFDFRLGVCCTRMLDLQFLLQVDQTSVCLFFQTRSIRSFFVFSFLCCRLYFHPIFHVKPYLVVLFCHICVWLSPSCSGLISPACKFCFWSHAACLVMVLLSPVLSFQLPQLHPIPPSKQLQKMKTNENILVFFHSKTSLCLYFLPYFLCFILYPFLFSTASNSIFLPLKTLKYIL